MGSSVEDFFMLNRRSFLVGAGAGLIAPRILDKFLNHLAVHGEPLMLADKNPTNTMFVSLDSDLELCLRYLDRRTWRDIGFGPGSSRKLEDWGATEDQLDEEISRAAYMAWSSRDIIAQRTCDLLKSLDLGTLSNQEERAGGIRFERPRKMGCVHFAYCDDLLSVSLLQARLNELGTGIAVEVV
jgi:hypothetical protein